MHAWLCETLDGVDALHWRELPTPEPKPGEVRVATLRKDQRVEVHLEFPPVLDFHQRDAQRTLLLSRAIVEPLRGQLAFDQVAGPRWRIRLTLPVDDGGDGG